MTVKFLKTAKNWVRRVALVCLLPLAACMGSGTSYLQDTGLNEPLPAPLTADLSSDERYATSPIPSPATPSPNADDLYADLPAGPNDTGTYPDLRAEPKVRIVAKPGEDVETLTEQMTALADAHSAGRISTVAYNQRLAYLRRLAKNHSADMLAQIGEPAN